MKILIVDDNETNRKLLRVRLEAENQEIREASDGVEAVRILEEEQIDAIISDILMPNMDGYRFCSEVRRLNKYDSIPFLIYTSTYLSPADHKLSLELGADAFLKKPSPPEQILEEIQRIQSPDYKRENPAAIPPDPQVMKEYNEVLIRKLEKKNIDLEKAKEEMETTNNALKASENRYHLLFEKNPLPMWVYDLESLSFLDVNEAAIRQYGYTRNEFLNMTLKDIRPLEDLDRLLEYHKTAADQSEPSELTGAGYWRHIKKDGSLIDVEIVWSKIHFRSKTARLALVNDITQRRIAEMALQEQVRLSAFSAEVGLALMRDRPLQEILQTCCQALVTYLEAAFARIWTLNAAENVLELQASAGMYTHLNGPHGRVPVGKFKIGLIAEERKPHLTNAVVGDPRVGDQEWARREGMVAFAGYPLIFGDQLVGVMAMFARAPLDEEVLKGMEAVANHIALGIHRDWTGKALRRAEENYREIFENAIEGIFQVTAEGKFLSANPALARMLGYKDAAELIAAISDITHQLYVEPWRQKEYMEILEKYGEARGFESELYKKNGDKIWVSSNVHEVRDTQNKLLYYEGSIEDITERKKSEAEKQNLEKQLLQSQKIEAIGQLAGGVAHDFNNLLMAIGGYSELLLLKLPQNDSLRKIVLEIQKGVNQGSNLTRQLLAFSRKQVLSPTILDLNQSITKIEDMLHRLIGEDIQLQISLQENLGFVKADPGQIHQVIMNLVVNARDAMPHGGKLTIETENVELAEEYVKTHPEVVPGYYVQIAIRDTGSGMDETTISRMFEPFFTTKEEGKGTGLGLSTVYGIVKQTEGHISVHSQLRHGTTFKINFPRVDESLTEDPISLPAGELTGKGEVILLVDDSESIRSAIGNLLQMKGYSLISVENGTKALETATDFKDTIHLLITDMVMPKMGGKELAQHLRKTRPTLKVLFMSGYTQETLNRQGKLETGETFLSKPVNIESLLTKIRELLSR